MDRESMTCAALSLARSLDPALPTESLSCPSMNVIYFSETLLTTFGQQEFAHGTVGIKCLGSCARCSSTVFVAGLPFASPAGLTTMLWFASVGGENGKSAEEGMIMCVGAEPSPGVVSALKAVVQRVTAFQRSMPQSPGSDGSG